MWVGLIPLLSGLLDKFFPNATDAANAKLKLMEMAQNGELAKLNADLQIATGQLAINATEASNTSLFVSGWRPFIGWTCGAAFAWNYLLGPMTVQILTIFGHPVEYAMLDLGEMMPVLLGMLGLGGLRTIEKLNAKA
jgi:hypothetical protein